jgi:acyl-CoA synthetase (AMP-forming)/AMP-acid ligase II
VLVPDFVRPASRTSPERPAVIAAGRERTFAELDVAADRAAAAMLGTGLQAGDRVALLAENELEYVELQVACDRAELVLVPLNHRCTRPELEYMISDAQPRLLIGGSGYEDAAAALEAEHIWHLGSGGPGRSYAEVLADDTTDRIFAGHRAASGPAAILYTSGTTGRPKGALISRGALWARATGSVIEHDIRPGDVFVQGLPMFHIAAHLAYGFTVRGATIVLSGPFDPARLANTIASAQATHVLVVPTMINAMAAAGELARARSPRLRRLLYGGSPIGPELLRRAIQQLDTGYAQMFGMTETFFASILRPEDHVPDSARLSSAGTDAVCMETRISGPDEAELGAGEIGEVWTRGPTVMDGYWKNPDATAAAVSEGWMHTGDLGYRDDDGYLFITGRVSEMIVSGGENVYPREVEDTIAAHPDVLDVAVIGLPDERWGERVHALVVLRHESSATTDDLAAAAREGLAGYKVPKTWELVDALPRNATGKVLKRELRAERAQAAARGLTSSNARASSTVAGRRPTSSTI